MGTNLRPTSLNEIIGQDEVKERLQIGIRSSQLRGECLSHIMLNGPAGTGKTSLAFAVANELGYSIQTANGAHLRSPKNLLPYVAGIKENSVLFIDEIHRISKVVAELLYTVLEDFRLDLTNGEETVSLPVERFTLIGATTDSGILPKPFYDRFIHHSLRLYTNDELLKLVKINSNKLNVHLSDDAGKKIAGAAKETPRILNQRLEWVRDFALAKNIGFIDGKTVDEAFKTLGITTNGLDANDINYLRVLKDTFKGGPVGVESIASALNIEVESVKSNIEPYLIRLGKVVRTKKGRISV